jgi:Niemann-Pick C1 protein
MGWYSTMGACEASAQARFDSVARTCAAKPWRAIGANLLLALILGLGFANVEIETKGDRLWVDQQSGLKKQMGYIEDMYATQQRVSFVALGANPTQGGDVLTAAPIADLMTIYERVMALETDDGFTWADACYRDAFGRCTVTGAIAFWSTIQAGINSSLYWHNATTAAVKARVQPPASGDWLYPSGSRVDNSVFLGLDAASAKAEVVRNFFWLQGDFDGRCVKEGLRGEDCTASKREEVQLELEEKMIELIEPYMLHDKEGLAQTVSASSVVYLQAFRSLDDELLRAVSGDIPLFSLTMILMCSFCCIVLGKSGSGSGSKWISSRILLANGGIGLVMFAMIGGYGLCAGLGFEFTQLQQILPFILIGIGVDDMVIIVSALDRVSELEPTLPVATRVGKAFARCGLSITLTSATDITAFLLGSVSKLPAIRLFCLYAAAAILLTYCFMCTGFAAMLALDISRMEGGRYDCCPCICGSLNVVQSATDPAATVAACPSHPLGGGGGGGGVLQRCMAAYARWLLKPLTKAAVLLIFGIALGLNIWGWTETTSGFELIDLTPVRISFTPLLPSALLVPRSSPLLSCVLMWVPFTVLLPFQCSSL